MQRGNTKHGPAHDDHMAHEMRSTLRANRIDDVEDWRDPESAADEEPENRQRPATG